MGALKHSLGERFQTLEKAYETAYQVERQAGRPKDTEASYDYKIETTGKQRARTTKGSQRNSHYGNAAVDAPAVKHERFDSMNQPVKSMFNFELKKAPQSSSLKERIKLNKELTLSPKGKVIGVNPRKRR